MNRRKASYDIWGLVFCILFGAVLALLPTAVTLHIPELQGWVSLIVYLISFILFFYGLGKLSGALILDGAGPSE